ncbi:Hsp33 family molecular chaperone HslO, partial [Citrobacter werkmanii]|uniref:Hsp33 family molecular chaperone HslO n=1 Tax=Citrobacter werkmanii TaxID=67827 RepID=UPI0021BD1352
ARFFQQPALRDVTIEEFNAVAHELDPIVAKRVRHILTENARTVEAASALEQGDLKRMGELMAESHEEEVTVYDPQDVEFKCTCSRERCADALKTLPDEEVDSILAEDGEIDMHCDYCGNHYLFNAMDIAEIRNNASPADP